MKFQESLIGFGGALLLLLLFHSVDAMAQDNVPRVIPYDGIVELDGGGYDGQIHMRVILYDGSMSELWREEYSSGVGADGPPVDVYGGHFSLLLGEYDALTPAVFDEPSVSIGIQLSEDAITWAALDGTQLIGSSPYALWSVALPPASVTATEIAAGAVQASEIATGAVGHDEIAANAVRASEIQADAVGTSEVDNNSLTRTDIAGEIAVYSMDLKCGFPDEVLTLESTCTTISCGTCDAGGGNLTIYWNCAQVCTDKNRDCTANAEAAPVTCNNTLEGYILAL